MDCVEKCGYNNQGLWLGFSLKKHSLTYVGNGVYIVWVEIVCIRYVKLAKHYV